MEFSEYLQLDRMAHLPRFCATLYNTCRLQLSDVEASGIYGWGAVLVFRFQRRPLVSIYTSNSERIDVVDASVSVLKLYCCLSKQASNIGFYPVYLGFEAQKW